VGKHSERAALIFYEKLSLNSGLVSERKILRLVKSGRYPLGFRYRLVLADPKIHHVILLYDNHWPKGPHVHWEHRERSYRFVGLEHLLSDFIEESHIEEKRYYESQKNHH
jgi:hypothetical protein